MKLVKEEIRNHVWNKVSIQVQKQVRKQVRKHVSIQVIWEGWEQQNKISKKLTNVTKY